MKQLLRGVGIVFILSCFWIFGQLPDDKFHLIFCDVGQGDAALVVKENFQMLIDTGPSPQKILSCLGNNLPFWDRQIEVVITTHEQKDHNGGLGEIQKRYKIVRNLGKELVLGDTVRYANLRFDVLWPIEKSEKGDENEMSVVGKLTYGQFRALFTADIGELTELALVDSGALGKITLIKVPHHGSKYSSNQKFLEEIRPMEAVVSVGKKNSYGHPAAEIMMRYDTLGSRVWRTDKNGEVEIVSDGKTYWVKAER